MSDWARTKDINEIWKERCEFRDRAEKAEAQLAAANERAATLERDRDQTREERSIAMRGACDQAARAVSAEQERDREHAARVKAEAERDEMKAERDRAEAEIMRGASQWPQTVAYLEESLRTFPAGRSFLDYISRTKLRAERAEAERDYFAKAEGVALRRVMEVERERDEAIAAAGVLTEACREALGVLSTFTDALSDLATEHPKLVGLEAVNAGDKAIASLNRALATDTGRALLDELAELRGKVAAIEKLLSQEIVRTDERWREELDRALSPRGKGESHKPGCASEHGIWCDCGRDGGGK